ncbi:unnamed protein product [Polarella glacialis]|nr:unnamed protein product [Polarella glacialis]
MEEADAPDGNAEQAVAVPRRSALRNFDRVERDSAPLDEDWCDMKSALDDIEIRLRVMQSKEVLQIQKPDKDEDQEAPPSSAFVAEMQAQNKHLRELLASERKSHLLNLDRGLFGAAGATSLSIQVPGPETAAQGVPANLS